MGGVPRPVIWKPRYATRRMRERAWARADLQREANVRSRSGGGDGLLRRLRDRLDRRRPGQ
jgi:hypothetical protein